MRLIRIKQWKRKKFAFEKLKTFVYDILVWHSSVYYECVNCMNVRIALLAR